MKSYFIKSHDGKKIFIGVWDEIENPKAVIQMVHGMGEHIGRYENVANYLNSKGFIVYGDDHRGHGKTAENIDKIGDIGRDGFNKIVEDEKYITDMIKRKYPNLPHFICGHSFGSFISQEYLNRYSNDIDGIILCGSALQKGLGPVIGRIVSTTQMLFGLGKKHAYFIARVTGNLFNKKINDKSNNKNADVDLWLTSDEEEIEKLRNDKFCNHTLKVNFYYYMFKGFKTLYKSEKNKNIRKDIPILLIAGKEDPVGNYGEAVKELEAYYKGLCIENVSLKIYDGKKHELFNELGREEIYDDLNNWLENIALKSIKHTNEKKYILNNNG